MITSRDISWEEFKEGILAIFSQKRKNWDESLREAERYQDESFEEWIHSKKALHMNFTLLHDWPFKADPLLAVTMRFLATTMVGGALDKYRIGDEWDIAKLKTIPYSQIIKDYTRWVERNGEKDKHFQSTLRPRYKTAATGKAQVAVVREERPREPPKKISWQKSSRYFCNVHGWNNSHPKDRCWSSKRDLPARGRSEVGQGAQPKQKFPTTGTKPKNPAKVVFLL